MKSHRARSFLKHTLPMIAVLIVAAALRFSDLNWDQSQYNHPDERHVTNVISSLQLPKSLGEYFDSARSPINPYNNRQSWVYGTLPLFVGRTLAEWFDSGCKPDNAFLPRVVASIVFTEVGDCNKGFFTGYEYVRLVGRFMSALADLITVFLVYLIGRRLFGWRVGLLASAFSALTVLQIQHSKFFVVESTLTMCVTACLYFCSRLVTSKIHSPRTMLSFWFNAALAGVFSGLAVASKISVWLLAVLVIVSIITVLLRDRRSSLIAVLDAFLACVIAGAFSFAAFRVSQPYGFVGSSEIEWNYTTRQCDKLTDPKQIEICAQTPPLPTNIERLVRNMPETLRPILAPSSRWIAELNSIASQATGEYDPPFGFQWANRAPITFPLGNIIFYGLGIPLGVTAILGVFYMLRQLGRGRRWWIYLIPTLWTVLFFLYQSTQYVKSLRYQLPIYPMLCVIAAMALVAVWRKFGRFSTNNARAFLVRFASALPIVLVLGGTALWTYAFMQIYNGELTRTQASRWMFENVPSAVTISGESNEKYRQFQLPVMQVALQPNAPQSFSFRLNKNDDQIDSSLSKIGLTLNYLNGSGEVLARLIDPSNNTKQEARAKIDATNQTITLDSSSIEPDKEYVVELLQMSGENISARTSGIAVQHWDEGLPFRIGGKDPYGGYYRGIEAMVYAEEDPFINEQNPGKYGLFLKWLDESDYWVLNSNRHAASVARLPQRFPMTIEFYRALLSGELGWELAADFNEQPRVGPFKINDQELPYTIVRSANTQGSPEGIWLPYPTAEEAFSVYDHNRVLIFRKTENYSRAKAEKLLGNYDLSRTIKSTAKQHDNKPRGLVFDSQIWQAQQAGGTWSELFPRTSPLNQSQPLAVIAWLVLIEMIGVAGFVFMASLMERTRDDSRASLIDGGWSFGKALGLLLVAFVSWMLASLKLATFDRGVIWLVAVMIFSLAAVVAYRNRVKLLALTRSSWKYILASELLFLAAFLFWIFVRAANPDLWHPFMGGEKPMDFAYLNAILKSTYFPPIDPWHAGGYINYYYFGWVFIGWAIKALGIDPTIAYNLAVPTLFALTAVGAFGLGASLYASRASSNTSRIIATGLLAALFVVVIGNGDQIRVVRPALEKLGGVEQGTAAPIALASGIGKWLSGMPLPTYPMAPYWDATRPAPEVMIAEFPNFTFLYADLHAHMMAMPIAYLALAFALAFALGVRRWLFVVLAAIPFGALWPTNTWDYFPYLLLGVAGLVIGRLGDERRTSVNALTFERVVVAFVDALPQIVALVALSRLFFAPYLENYGSAYSKIEDWGREKDHTQLKTYITIYGLFMIPLAVNALRSLFVDNDSNTNRIGLVALVASAVGAIVLMMRGAPSSLLSVPMTILSLAVALSPRTTPNARLLWLMNTGAFALTVFVEHFVLQGDIERMNTVFKFYIVAWLLLGVTSAVMLMWVIDLMSEKLEQTKPTHDVSQTPSFTSTFAQQIETAPAETIVDMPLKVESQIMAVGEPQPLSESMTLTTTSTPNIDLFQSSFFKMAFGVGAAIAIFLALLYPVFAIPAKMRDRYVDSAPRSLDGMAYMLTARRAEEFNGQRADFELRHDYDAIKWLQDHVKGSPVIIEEGAAAGNQYRWSARYSIYTGLPSVAGWQWHQMQQRASADNRIVQDRVRDVNEFYSTPDIERAKILLRRYGVKYVIYGQMERVYNAPEGFAKFNAMVQSKMLNVVYQNPDVTIYEVISEELYR